MAQLRAAPPGVFGKITYSVDTRRADRYMRLHNAQCGCYLFTKGSKSKLVGTPKAYLDWIDAQTPKTAKKIHTFLEARGSEIAAFVENALMHHKVRKVQLTSEEIAHLLDSYNWDNWDAIIGILNDDFYEAYIDAANAELKVLGMDGDTTITSQVDERAVAYAKEQSASLVGKRVLDDGSVVDNPNAAYAITDTTRDGIQALVGRGVKEGMSVEDLAKEITDNYAFSEERATTIARTELADSHTQGNLGAWKDSGVVSMKQSILGSEHGPQDEDECDDNAQEGPIPLEDDFPSGDDGPPYHPNCICALAPVLSDEYQVDDTAAE